MRPNLSRRGLWGASALLGALLVVPATRAYANSQEGVYETTLDDGDDDAKFDKQVKEVEKSLNEFLTVDEDKKVHIKKEFREGLPMPAEQVERMLQMSVKIGDDGKIRLRNPEQIRPFLPQIEGFLK